MSGLLQFNFFPTDFYYPKPSRVESVDKAKSCVQSVSTHGFKKEKAIVVRENNQSGLILYVNGETKRFCAASTFLEYSSKNCDSTTN
ncbi:hypothetical protein EUTSA_v10017489mg [Eutrema salsugineum]|uniref:Uncharacterized protein n=1 Tax=Eutrema salsugineum TaxID=72664 RepID=V4M937_EUTSA|nr:hypothetical protein EUTSA_v10017489mg [Eutrema salsugineum]